MKALPFAWPRMKGFIFEAESLMKKTWNKRTNLVHSGNRRSQYNEVSESIFLTQSYVYETAEDAEKRFSEDVP